MTVIGLTWSKKSLIPGWDKSSIRKLIVGIGQSGRGGVGGGGGMETRSALRSFDGMVMKSCDTIHNPIGCAAKSAERGYDMCALVGVTEGVRGIATYREQ
jgi:hypothetical protein